MCEEKKSDECSCAKCLHPLSLVFRIAGLALAVAAAGLMATASQCTVYDNYGARPYIITYSDFPAFVYLAVATSIVACMEALAIFLSVSKKGKSKKAKVLMPFLGVAMPALLYSSTGAAFAAGWDISYYLEPSGRRFSVCGSTVGGRFCSQVHVSMWLSLGAAVAVSIAELLTALQWSHGDGGDGGSGSDSNSESACGHGCHCRH